MTFANPETGYTIAGSPRNGVGRRGAGHRGRSAAGRAGGDSAAARPLVVPSEYGRQFEVASYATVLPATAAGIQKYLGSGLIKGIGPVMAERMVAYFGVDIMHVIEETPARLIEVDGLGPSAPR